MATRRPTTRTSTELWLIGHPIDSFNITELPSRKEVLALLMNYKNLKKLPLQDAVLATAADVLDAWERRGIPARLKRNVVKKVKAIYGEWTKLKKNKGNKAKRTETIIEKEQRWKKRLDELFDIKPADDNDCVKRKLQEEQSMSPSSETNSDEDTEYVIPEPHQRTVKKKRQIVDEKLSACLDMAKMSNRAASLVLIPAIQSIGEDPTEYSCSYSSIRRERLQHREEMATHLKEQFRPNVPLCVHWDGKMLPDITGRETVDRLPILVSGEGVEQLLSVPKLDSGTGLSQASAVHEAIETWGISSRIKCMCFDTTAANTGLRKGACVLLEDMIQQDMLWLACHHHVLEIMLEAVVSDNLPSSTGPEIVMFKKFRNAWPTIDTANYSADDDVVALEVADLAEGIIKFARDQLQDQQPRDDYKELLQLTILFLGGVLPRGAFSFKAPAGLHRARWMAKAIYALKIWLFRSQFPLSPAEVEGLREICLFSVVIYVKAWFTAPSAAMAPNNDLQLLKVLQAYASRHHRTAFIATKKLLGHLWYISEELVALAFFDDRVSLSTKELMVRALKKEVEPKRPLRRVALDASNIEGKELQDFVTVNTLRFFQITGLQSNFLELEVEGWSTNEEYLATKSTVKNLKVVNDLAERGVALMEEYNRIITNQEEQKQYLLQVVKHYRQKYPDRKKSTLIQ